MLLLTDFTGKTLGTTSSQSFNPEQRINLRDLFPILNTPGTYILYALPPGRKPTQFVGTPLVVDVREDTRPGAPTGPAIIHVDPLCFALLKTAQGTLRIAFYYDAAPHTVRNFIQLGQRGFYDGLTFHRIVPGFIIQGGDPRGDGRGGPGYQIDAEFSSRPHLEGVLSMARATDPNEQAGALPRSDFANSAGSQFFICLNYEKTRALNGRYTAFGQVVDGMPIVHTLAAVPIADPQSGRPADPPVIQEIRIIPVTHDQNPYESMLSLNEADTTPVGISPTTVPTTQPRDQDLIRRIEQGTAGRSGTTTKPSSN
ncbi:MAG: peptidylprolyl isomerase [Phycisphaerales bacterium]|nr:peptidylprolyl isomerase [Phycisphaerales bacterium]